MYEACIAFVQNWEETIEQAFIHRDGNEKLEQDLWYEKTQACQGVSTDPPPPNMGATVNIDGKEVPIGEDGTINIQPDDL